MDKYEYNLRIEQMKNLYAEEKYSEAAEMADKVNWDKVRNVNALLSAGDIYEKAGRLDDARDLLLLAYDRSPIGRKIIARLAEIAVELKDFDAAHEYYDEFVDIAPNENLRYAIWYKIRKAEGAKNEELISILEEYKDQEYTEQWAYELACLYQKTGDASKCAETCDELILWFGEGDYVERALELKMKYKPLTRSQEEKYRSYRMVKEGITQVDEEAMSRAGEYAHAAVSIPEVEETAESFDTANLQREIAIGIQQIMDATEEKEVSKTMDNLKRIVEEIPYLQVMKKQTDTGTIPVHIESDEEIDKSLRMNFKEMLEEEQDGQISLVTEPAVDENKQITGQLSIQDVLDDWERTMRKAEAAMEAADKRKLESAKARAITEAEDLMQRLTGVIPMLEAGMTPEDLMHEKIMSNEDPEAAPEPVIVLEEPIAFIPEMPKKKQKTKELPPLVQEDKENTDNPILVEEAAALEVKAEPAEEEKDVITDIVETEADTMMNENEDILLNEEETIEITDNTPRTAPEEDASVVEAPAEEPQAEEAPASEDDLSAMISEIEEEIKADNAAKGKNAAGQTKVMDKIEPEEDVVEKAMASIKAASEKKTGAKLKTAPLFMTSPATGMKDTTIMPQIDDDREFEVVDEIPAEAGYSINDSLLTQETKVISRASDEDLELEGEAAEAPQVDETAAVKKQHTVPFAFSKAQLNQLEGADADIQVDNRMHISELTKEMRSAFSYFVPIRGMEDQLCEAINDISDRLTSSVPVVGGNLIISGEAGCGKTVLATSFIKVLQGYCGLPNGKIGKINASALIKKNVQQVFEKVSGGCLIIENAGNLDRNTAGNLAFLMDCDSVGTLVILEDTIPGIKLALSLSDAFAKKFSSKINVPLFTNDELVTFARTYAKELGYKIDDMAILALHNRISNIQRLDQATTLAEVKDIVDEAIERESHFGLFKYFSLVTGKRYTKDDRILLTERNFTK